MKFCHLLAARTVRAYRTWEPTNAGLRCLFLFLFLAILNPIKAQSTNAGAISGVVTDGSHALVVGAKVAVTNLATRTVVKTTTNKQGEYRVQNLAAGGYKVEVTAAGFALYESEVNLTGARPAAVNVALKVASRSEVMQVQADRPLIGDTPDAPGKKDYLITSSSAGSKVELPDNWVAQSVASIPAKMIEDQGLTSVVGALQDVSGATNTYPSYYMLDAQTSSYFRGFSVGQTLRNGLWDSQSNGNIGWLGSVDHIEFLKGPAGLEYGTYWTGIGGVINLVTKKPFAAPRYQVATSGDSYGSWSLSGDISQPITKKWLTRTNLTLSNTQYFARNYTREMRDGSFVLQGLITPNDAVTLEYERRWQNSGAYSGLLGYAVTACNDSTGTAHSYCVLPLNMTDRWINLYAPVSSWTFNAHDLHAGYVHRFNRNWRVTWAGSLTRTGRQSPQLLASLALTSTNVGTTSSPIYEITSKYTEAFGDIHMGPELTWDTDTLLEGHFTTHGVQHVFDAGYRFSKGGYHMNMFKLASGVATTFTDPENPTWASINPSNAFRYVWGNYSEQNQNIYFNDIASLTRKLRVTGGVNYTPTWKSDGGSVFASSATSPLSTAPTYTHTTTADGGQAWRVGAMYDFLPGFTAFGDYATTFEPQGSNVTTTGVTQYFDPLTGSQYELGVKALVAKAVTLTATVYKLKLSNMLVSDPDPTLSTEGFKAEIGSEHSRGFELDGKYHLNPGWDILTAYAYTDARVGETASYVQGSAIPNVSKQSFRIFAIHKFEDGVLKGLEAGGGVHAVSRFTTNLVSNSTSKLYYFTQNNTSSYQLYEVLPGYATVDARLAYEYRKLFKVTANVQNLLNSQYWATASSYGTLYPGQPVVATFGLQKTF